MDSNQSKIYIHEEIVIYKKTWGKIYTFEAIKCNNCQKNTPFYICKLLGLITLGKSIKSSFFLCQKCIGGSKIIKTNAIL